jgi:hypothetical protein
MDAVGTQRRSDAVSQRSQETSFWAKRISLTVLK